MLIELKSALSQRGLAFSWDDNLLDYLTKASYSITYGARNLRRTIQRELEDPIAERIIDSFECPISLIHVRAQDGKPELDVQ